ncbi:MAG: aminoglycoside phosphotransferase family protein [Oscillospiraceae bacterium]|nr:aminoglycoside phosphotransferase family protein [Oscillospiraceae bacterium]
MNKTPFDIDVITEKFGLKGNYTGYEVNNNGHINSTFILIFEENGKSKKYILQMINTSVFKDPERLMSNIVGITAHIRKKAEDSGIDSSRATLHFRVCNDGKYYYEDSENRCWRVYDYIGDVYTCNTIDSVEVFCNAGKAFGDFQKQLADYDSSSLFETIENFHNTVSRFGDLKRAIIENAAGRLDSVRDEVDFALCHEPDAHVLVDLISDGKLPLRVTHNDTKLNNILFDNTSNKGICIIDLDTVMPGLSLYDFGDSIRFGANTATEDEKDVLKVSLNLELYEAYVKGYLSSAKDALTECEKEYLPFSAKLMTYECGIRFLTDYLNGDTYFKTDYPEHNLVRCRTQFALVEDIERKTDEMIAITKKYC